MVDNDYTPAQVEAMLDGWIDDLPDGSVLLRLRAPLVIKVGRNGAKPEPVEITELHLRRPKASILDILSRPGVLETKAAREAIATLLPPLEGGGQINCHHLDNLDVDDITRATLVMGRFFPKPPPAPDSGTTET